MRARRWPLIGALAVVSSTGTLSAQEPLAESVDALVQRAMLANPTILAARQRVEAAGAAVGPAAALGDPMLMLGFMNQPLSGGREDMAMRVIGVGQTLPFPGKRRLQRAAAEDELAAARAELEVAQLDLEAEVKESYYEIAFLDRSQEVLERSESLLSDVVGVTEARYRTGTTAQVDVLEARVELAGLAEEAVTIAEARRAAVAQLNALLDRPSETPIPSARLPERLEQRAVPADRSGIRFTSSALGARAENSPLPPLADLQVEALASNAQLRAHEAMIAAHANRVALAQKAHLPDIDLSLQYGQRGGMSDLLSATVSLPLPVHRSGRQDLDARQAEATLAAMHAEHAAEANALGAEIAGAYADVERARAQLALLATAILPHGRAAAEAAAAGLQVGRGDALALLESQGAVFGYEIAYHRALADFAIGIAKLDRLVGREILP